MGGKASKQLRRRSSQLFRKDRGQRRGEGRNGIAVRALVARSAALPMEEPERPKFEFKPVERSPDPRELEFQEIEDDEEADVRDVLRARVRSRRFESGWQLADDGEESDDDNDVDADEEELFE